MEINKDTLVLKDEIEKLANALLIVNQNVTLIGFVVDYIVDKLQLDTQDLTEYLQKRVKELEEEQMKKFKESNIVVPS